MAKRVQIAVASLLLIVASACGVSVRATPFPTSQRAPQPAEAPVQMFSTKTPECPYEELGLLRAEQETWMTPWQRVVDTFLMRARQMGGEGVILQPGVELRASGEGELVSEDVLSGTVIRFERAGCQQ